MNKYFQIILIVLAVAAVAVGDVFLKQASLQGDFERAVKSPWMAGAVTLYAYQIIFFTYVFVAGWQLSIVGILQTVLYTLIVLAAGVFYFKEALTVGQCIGATMAFVGVIFMSLET